MKARLDPKEGTVLEASIALSGSKSESNRLLILQALFPNINIENLSTSDDTRVLGAALLKRSGIIDVHHAGTAMRFLTAYFATQEGVEVILTGSERMQQRPIGILVDALRSLGAHIEYELEEGYPPLKIVGKTPTKDSVSLAANVSSQFITALMLVAPSLPKGLTLQLKGKVTSRPYIEMTLSLLKECGIHGSFEKNSIRVAPARIIEDITAIVESDWSSASYFYSLIALSKGGSVVLKSFNEDSLQGDSALSHIYRDLGVQTTFYASENKIRLNQEGAVLPQELELDLSNTPDIAQTIAVTCLGLGRACYLKGLHTLKIKETDRLLALKTELEKLGATVLISEDTLRLIPASELKALTEIETYNDHRMAMAFAPLAFKVPMVINDPEVVSKSYPAFWRDLSQMGIEVTYP